VVSLLGVVSCGVVFVVCPLQVAKMLRRLRARRMVSVDFMEGVGVYKQE
jgi:hypothetical protein